MTTAAFWQSLAHYGDHPAVINAADGQHLSYRQLAATVEAMQAQIGPSSRKRLVFLIAANQIATLCAYLAVLQAGDVVLPFGQGVDSPLLAALVSTYQPDLVIAGGLEGPSVLPDWAVAYAMTHAAGVTIWHAPETEEAPSLHPDLALLLTTSGSTGNPKLVRLSAQAVAANARQIAAALRMTTSERAITTLSMGYSFGLSVINSHLHVGATLVLSERSLLEPEFWDEARAAAVTTLAGVPFTYDLLRRTGAANKAPPSLIKLLQAGGRMSPAMIDWTRKNFAQAALYVMYGQTEATARMAVLPPEDAATGHGSVGYALPEAAFHCDPDGQVLYTGPNVMMGYATCRADLAKADQLGGLLPTGDLGRLDAAGRLWLTGRLNRIAKPFGVRVSLDDLETRLNQLGTVAVVSDDTTLTVVYEQGEAEALRRLALELLAELKLAPSLLRWQSVERLPRGENGKIRYADLIKK